ncbi:MAG TPA: hypothetical protein VIF62_28130 [Labilithrix sp.]
MKRRIDLLFAALAVAACGSGSSTSTATDTAVPTASCFDASGAPTSTCAVALDVVRCPLGDANVCTPLVKTETFADDGKNGVCVHVVFENHCSGEIYADTCIEQSGGRRQCWTSSVLAGEAIDVSACNATGHVFDVATTSAGALDLDEAKCPAPMP